MAGWAVFGTKIDIFEVFSKSLLDLSEIVSDDWHLKLGKCDQFGFFGKFLIMLKMRGNGSFWGPKSTLLNFSQNRIIRSF